MKESHFSKAKLFFFSKCIVRARRPARGLWAGPSVGVLRNLAMGDWTTHRVKGPRQLHASQIGSFMKGTSGSEVGFKISSQEAVCLFSLMSDPSTTVSVTLANISIALGAGNTEMARAERDPSWGRR